MTNINPKIIICMDGTWNNQGDNTNVFQIKKAIDRLGDQQHVRYLEGVGNKGFVDKYITGGPTGWGITEQIVEAYREIVNNYKQGKEVWLFGFSRGAYAARSLSGFLNIVGVIDSSRITSKRINDHYINSEKDIISDAYKYYQLPENPGNWHENFVRQREFGFTHRSEMEVAGEKFSEILTEAKDPDYRTLASDEETDLGVKVEFLGVWDTVGSLGSPTFLLQRALKPLYSFHDTSISPNVTHAYQALALHEVRRQFSPDIWRKKHKLNINQTIIQKWFSGSHSNVGGSDHNRNLSNLTLRWMFQKAKSHGLVFKKAFEEEMKNFKPDYLQPVEFSREALPWKIIPAKIREMIKIEYLTDLDKEIRGNIFRHESVERTYKRTKPFIRTYLNRHKEVDELSKKINECKSVEKKVADLVFDLLKEKKTKIGVEQVEGGIWVGDKFIDRD